jgi:hypothetical protein
LRLCDSSLRDEAIAAFFGVVGANRFARQIEMERALSL